jgi:hypothetical protein
MTAEVLEFIARFQKDYDDFENMTPILGETFASFAWRKSQALGKVESTYSGGASVARATDTIDQKCAFMRLWRGEIGALIMRAKYAVEYLATRENGDATHQNIEMELVLAQPFVWRHAWNYVMGRPSAEVWAAAFESFQHPSKADESCGRCGGRKMR